MSVDVASIVERARIASQDARRDGEVPGTDREKLQRIAAEFESMLLVQMLKDMRKAGSWDEEEGGDGLGLDASALFETIDVELATQLARAKGMGLQSQMLEAFERTLPKPDVKPVAGSPVSAVEATGAFVSAPVKPPDKARSVVDAVASAPAVIAEGALTLLKPVAGAVTSAFGWRRHPVSGGMKFHQGVDLRAAYGEEVKSAAAGTVVFSGSRGAYGNTVVVQHGDGTRTRYAHLSTNLVASGDRVDAGAPVGRAGNSGRVTGTHLHFEVIGTDGRRIAPKQWERAESRGRSTPGGAD